MPPVALPPAARASIYYGFAVVGVALGATQVGFAAANAGQPTWLTVALAVYAFVGPALGLTAASNTPTGGDEPVPADAAVIHTAHLSIEEVPDAEPVVYNRSERPIALPDEDGDR